jgi:hypothetical protein
MRWTMRSTRCVFLRALRHEPVLKHRVAMLLKCLRHFCRGEHWLGSDFVAQPLAGGIEAFLGRLEGGFESGLHVFPG